MAANPNVIKNPGNVIMKKAASLIWVTVLFVSAVHAQQTEYSLHFNSGLFSFAGESAAESSSIIVSDISGVENYTNNPYGANNALGYGLALQIQRVTGGRHILGLQGGFETLRSHVRIEEISGDYPTTIPPVSGKTILRHGFIHLYPNIGHNFSLGLLDMDVTIGPEFGFALNSREKGIAAVYNNVDVKTDRETEDPGTDLRLRSSLTLYYQNWGVSAGYSHGFHNYTGGLLGGDRETFSRYIRFGLAYRIR